MKKNYITLLFAALFVLACNKDDDGLITTATDVQTQDFMWKSMNLWYFWQADVDVLADDRFSSDEEYTNFLRSESDPANFFDNQLRFVEDRFSNYSSDYEDFTNFLSGITKSNGLSFGLIALENDNVVGYVRYVTPNSDAATKDIFRGEFFTGVDGQTLTLNNYIDLLFGENDTYTLNMADLVNDTFTPNDKEVTLTKQEGFQENPIFVVNTFDVNGQKIGYIYYNRFLNEFDEELNDAFGQLKAQGITDLVLDLRYNPGGSVNTTRLMASMIYGTNNNDLFIKQRWNPKIQASFDDSDLEDYFTDRTGEGTSINTLNLSRVFIITTGRSASASELIINGLDPYMDVIQVGTTTTGKNEFSLTMVDDPGRSGLPYVYSPSRESSINPENRWALQPLVGRNENSVGFSDYTAGFTPEIELEEDLANLGVLGDINEPLLARAIEEITGVSGKRDFTVRKPARPFADPEVFSPVKDNMILDKPLNLKLK
ncbi:S41 family peptidase [Muriicola soli]|uniref:Carboxyl-terminal protease n=1 Tax=Muriicola soli TaxID=2507538 RepID=A0A411E9Q5_9FLAO|nr:S41 family peptidase [Muriicola soli]QBA64432.1 carboxyl-terminal protease [Muriicola soli]